MSSFSLWILGRKEQFVASKGNEVKLKDLVKKGQLEEIAIGEDPKS